ncbi:precorrin-3B C(17)-methyltransferase [Actinosynnema sp. NPDC020468]|uniref:SecDF P1 head subdomain-containing protein n=1 Tax=Actinosynnema sp. NPDC020468 TaxID=3154488 RepID=UPI0033D36D05
MVGALAVLLVLAGCGSVAGTAKPEGGRIDPSRQVSATGAPKLVFRPVLQVGSASGTPVRTSGLPPEPTKPATPEAEKDVTRERSARQSPTLAAGAAAAFATFRCPEHDPLAGLDDPTALLLVCDVKGESVYLLGPAFLDNRQITSSSSGPAESGGFVVTIGFTEQGTKTWGEFTAANVGNQVALVYNTAVLSAPSINGAIPDGVTEISGRFTQSEARDLADQIAGR